MLAQDRDGKPLADAVVYVLVPNHAAKAPAKPALMIQHDLTFDPYVLPVMTGTQVVFPNKDRVSHHLRTMSAATEFEFPVYEPGVTPKPVRFDKAGPTPLFCHFHLSMRGYVYAVDTPFFARTDANGAARIEGVPDGEFQLHAWHPDWVRPPLTQTLRFTGAPQNVSLKLDLRPSARPKPQKPRIETYRDY